MKVRWPGPAGVIGHIELSHTVPLLDAAKAV